MRKMILAIGASVMLATGAAAQGTAPPAGTPVPVPPGTAAAPAPGQGVARTACRTETDQKSLTGPERKAAMAGCMKAHVEACRKNAADAHVPARNGERRDFVRRCMQQGA